MPTIDYLLLAVANPRKSAELYGQILGAEPVAASDTFVLFAQPNGFKLGLWLKDEMLPATGKPDGIDISFGAENNDAVRTLYDRWTGLGLKVLQELTDMDFGFTFTVADPDGHRLRAFALNANPQ
jgi:catechol 2,3-dioxygenase-like lactoylglutathione lyase family enzyme